MTIMPDEKSRRTAVEAVATVEEEGEKEGILRAVRVKTKMMTRTWTLNYLQNCKPWSGVMWTRRKYWWTTMIATSMRAMTRLRRERGML